MRDFVVDVLLRAQKGTSPLGLTINRHFGRGFGSVGRRYFVSKSGEAGNMRRPHQKGVTAPRK